MLQEVIQFLINNADVLEKVKEGTASLIGVSEIEKQAIIEVLINTKQFTMSYWN